MCKDSPQGIGHDQATPAAVVVDPYSSGKYLLLELAKRNIPIIAVRSTTKMSNQFLRSHEDNSRLFSEMLEFEDIPGGLVQLVQTLKMLPYQVMAVLPGSEPGVELANLLSNALGLSTTNPVQSLAARTDKAEMQEALKRNKIPSAKQFKSGELSQLLNWAECEDQWPLVAKPVGGAGSEGIFFCKDLDDIRAAHQHIVGNRSATGALNSEMALQEFLSGDEYIVDTVSLGGKHLCVAIWVYEKIRGLPWNPTAIISAQNMLLSPSGEVQDTLVDYVFKVLDAVGLQNGPCHTEVMMTQRGPILVEVNARMHGLQGPRLIEMCTGISKASYAVDAMVCGGELFGKLYQESPSRGRYLYPVLKNSVCALLVSPVEGYLEVSLEDTISKMNLPSVLEILPSVAKGAYISKTKDLPTTPGTVLMVHESIEQINADIRKIREAEASLALYPVSKSPFELS